MEHCRASGAMEDEWNTVGRVAHWRTSRALVCEWQNQQQLYSTSHLIRTYRHDPENELTPFMPDQNRLHSKNRRVYLFTYLFHDAVSF